MMSIKLRLRNFFQWSVCALAFLVVSSVHAADMNHYDIIDLATDGLMPSRLKPLPSEQTRIHEGMLDVTKAPYFADNTGTTNAHAAIQNAIDDAYLASLVVYFPSGTYLCSDNFTCFQTNLFGFRTSRKYTHKLVGSTEGPRPVLKLMDNAPLTYESIPGVGDPEAPLFIHFAWRGDIGGSYEEAGEKGYGLLFRGIDIDMGNNPNNSAMRMNGAQYSFIEDVHIYGTDFVWGVEGTPGGGGSVANLKVTGGKKGLSIGRTVPTIMGVTLEGQSELGMGFWPVGPGVVTGFSIKGPASPSAAYRAVYAYSLAAGDKAGNSNFVMVDGTIEVPGSTGIAVDSYNQDVHLQNVYVKAATIVESGHKKAPGEILLGDSSSWQHVRRYACRSGNDSAAMMIDGVTLGTAGQDHVYYEPLLTVPAPPTNLVSQHIWSEADFPSWEDADRISITDFGAIAENVQGSAFDNAPAIQAALDSATTVGSTNFGKTVFIPRGIFNVSSPITVPAGAKLIGAGNSMAQIDVSTSWAPTAATSVLITEDDPTAEVVLAHFAIVCKEADEAGSGFPDTTAHRFIRHATIQSGKTLWRNIQLDVMNQSGVGRQRTEPLVQISNNAGGRFYTLVVEDSGSDTWAPGHPEAGYNKVRVSNTTLPISFYQLNPGHLRQATGQVRLDNCQDIRIYSLKSEAKDTLRNLGATDVAHLQVFGSDGLHELTNSAAYVALIGQCTDVRIANLSHRLYSVYGLYYLNDVATGDTLPDTATLALYAKDAPQLRLYDGASISGPELFDGSTGADFGEVFPGSPLVKTFTICNGGFADLTSLVVTVDGANSADFVVSALGSTTVTPGASTTFTITFTPSATASRTATAHIASNDPGTAFDVSLVGEGSLLGSAMMPMLDSAFVRGGANADIPQAWTDALPVKNAADNNNRIAMIKVDASSFSGTVGSATLTVFGDDNNAHTLYVYGVNDSASFQDWTGGTNGNVTWNSVIANGLFTPKENLYTLGDANLTLLGSQAFSGLGVADVSATLTNQALVDWLNTDTDGLATLVFCSDSSTLSNVRPDTHANAPTLVIIPNQPPAFGSDPFSKSNATQDVAYSGSISGDASDPESNPMTFSKVSGPAWLNVATNGTLSGTPSNSDVGANAFTVQVDAAGDTDTATLNITVDNVNDAPTFTVDPMNTTNALEGVLYSDTIAGSATDVDSGDTLTYSKTAGPAWLSVASDGALSGTPANGDVGANAFTVKVEDAAFASDTATLNITVAPSIAKNAALPMLDSAFVRGGASADIAQTWTDALATKNAADNNNRIAMIKVDASGVSGAIASATLTAYSDDNNAHTLYVYGVNDSATGQDWTGGDTGSATWNSVIANGLFTPKENLYTLGDANLTLIGSQAFPGLGTGDVSVTLTNQVLIDWLNNDSDGLVTLVFCSDAGTLSSVRPHTHANAPTLEYVYRVPNITYAYWLSDHLSWLGSETNKNDNKDGDSFNNMAEYALGGNPTNGTDTAIPPFAQMMQAGGTNYIEYVHLQRNDTDALEYRVEVTTNLISGIWTNTLVQIIGTNTAYGVDGFDAVTNRVPAGPKQQFIHLKIK